MTTMDEQTVFIVDDDDAVRDAIEELVGSVGWRSESYSSGQAFLDAFLPTRSGCVVLDVRMAGMSGLAVQEKLSELGATLPVIVITGHGDVPMAVEALKSGAVDFIQKPYRDQLLLDAVHKALEADAAVRRSSAGMAEYDRRVASLTPREREVLAKLLEGGIGKQIAAELGISPRTVEAHRHNLLRKLRFDSVKDLILFLAQPE